MNGEGRAGKYWISGGGWEGSGDVDGRGAAMGGK